MNVKVENLEKSMAKLTIEVAVEEVEKAIEGAYQKQKKNISMQGFRKGKVPRAMVEKMHGVEVFYEDAANILIQQEYPKAMDESGLDIVSQPTIDVEQLEKGKSFIFTAEVAVKPEVELGTYKGVTVTKVDTSVKAAEVNAEVEKQREANARTVSVEDRGIKKDDIAIIDFDGSIDGTPFEGGKAENHELVIGSHSFIDTFEDQLIGKKVGDDIEVNVSFPEDYHAAELAGKPALFKVKIHEIKTKELPKLDDEFAQDISEFNTLKEYKADLKKKLIEEKERAAKGAQEDEAIRTIIEDSKIDIPDPMLQLQCQQMVEGMSQQMAQQGLSMDQYFQFTGTSMEQLMEQVKPEATNRIKASLVLEAIAAKEKFEITEEKIEAELSKMAEMYHMEVEKIKEIMGENENESMKRDLSIQEAVNFINENLKIVAAEKEETEEVEEEEE